MYRAARPSCSRSYARFVTGGSVRKDRAWKRSGVLPSQLMACRIPAPNPRRGPSLNDAYCPILRRGPSLSDGMGTDFRYALRLRGRSPGSQSSAEMLRLQSSFTTTCQRRASPAFVVISQSQIDGATLPLRPIGHTIPGPPTDLFRHRPARIGGLDRSARPAHSGIRAFLREESGAIVAQIEWKQLTVVSTPGIPGSGTGTPDTVDVDIADLPAAIGMSLQPGEALRFELKLSYVLNGTTQSAADYPVTYTAFREVCGFMGVDFVGESGCAEGDGSFITRAN